MCSVQMVLFLQGDVSPHDVIPHILNIFLPYLDRYSLTGELGKLFDTASDKPPRTILANEEMGIGTSHFVFDIFKNVESVEDAKKKIFLPWGRQVVTDGLRAELSVLELLGTFETLCSLRKPTNFAENRWKQRGTIEVCLWVICLEMFSQVFCSFFFLFFLLFFKICAYDLGV